MPDAIFVVMIDIPGQLLKWSESRPMWQRDALRRVVTQATVGPTDIAELVTLAQRESASAVENPPTAAPLLADHLTRAYAAGEHVVLSAIHSVKDVNALAEGQTLTFIEIGLTSIYGDNGAGKSGYGRIMGSACRARRAERVLPNINAKTTGKPTATFTIKTATRGTHDVTWQEGAPAPAKLARIAVFDRRCELSFIEEEGELMFLPAGLDVFNALVRVVEQVKKAIEDAEQREKPKDAMLDLPALVLSSKEISDFISRLLGSGPKDFAKLGAELDRLAGTPADESAIAEVERKLAELKTNDPTQKAASLRTLSASVARARAAAAGAMAVLSKEGVDRLRNALTARASAKASAEALAVAGLSDGKDIVSDLGMAFLNAADAYAQHHVHPGHAFPDLRPDATCLLCRQELAAPARDRFQRLHALLTQTTAQHADTAATAADGLVLAVQNATMTEVDEVVIGEMEKVDAASAAVLRELPGRIAACKAGILKAAGDGSWAAVVEIDGSGLDTLSSMESAASKQAIELERLADPRAQNQLRQELTQLKAKVELAHQKARVAKYIEMAGKAAALSKCAAGINTRAITNEGTAIAEKAMSGGLATAFEEELAALGAATRIKAKIHHRGDKGKTLFGITIPGSAPMKWTIGQVLSEGERRVVALAYFLAEARMAPHRVSLIIDDPVCSLDHQWSRRIGERLLKLAKDRQIIVFTHNIGFFTYLALDSTQFETPLQRLYLNRGASGPGYCDAASAPWEKLDVKARFPRLEDKLKEATAHYAKNPDGPEFREASGSMVSQLRATWERAVEEVVLFGVIERFSYLVKTQSLAGVVFDDNAYKAIYDAMTRLSGATPAHDHAGDGGGKLFDPSELASELAAMKAFIAEHKAKALDTEKNRKAKYTKPSVAVAKPGVT